MRVSSAPFWIIHLVEGVRQPHAGCSTRNPTIKLSTGEIDNVNDVHNSSPPKSAFGIPFNASSERFVDHARTTTSYLPPSSFISTVVYQHEDGLSMQVLVLIMIASLLLGTIISSTTLVCYLLMQRQSGAHGKEKGSKQAAGDATIQESTESDSSDEDQWHLKDGKESLSGKPEENNGGALSRTLARGKERRGADSADKYKFGDFTRGAIASLHGKKKTKGGEDVNRSDTVHFATDVSQERLAQTVKERASPTSFER